MRVTQGSRNGTTTACEPLQWHCTSLKPSRVPLAQSSAVICLYFVVTDEAWNLLGGNGSPLERTRMFLCRTLTTCVGTTLDARFTSQTLRQGQWKVWVKERCFLHA